VRVHTSGGRVVHTWDLLSVTQRVIREDAPVTTTSEHDISPGRHCSVRTGQRCVTNARDA